MQVAYQWMTNPTLIGPDARLQLADKAKELKMTKVLIVSDPGIQKAGVLDEPIALLDKAGIKTVLYTEVNSDPLDTKCEAAAELAVSEKCDGIIAIGGGSTMDCAKAADILTANPAPLYQYYGSWDYKRGVPLICMPTSAGTGSENTIYGVINATKGPDAGMKKVVLYTADMAICDPVLTYNLPPALTASTGLDAFAHCAEAVTCNCENYLVDVIAMDGISRISKFLPVAYRDPTNTEARNQMMIAANFGGVAFSQTCCHLGHAIAQQAGAVFHLPHGIACAWALPETMAYAAIWKPEKVKMIARFLEIPYEETDTPEQVGQKVADGIRAFMRKLDVKSLKDYGVKRDEFVNISGLVMRDNCIPFLPHPLTEDEVKVILGKVYDTYQ